MVLEIDAGVNSQPPRKYPPRNREAFIYRASPPHRLQFPTPTQLTQKSTSHETDTNTPSRQVGKSVAPPLPWSQFYQEDVVAASVGDAVGAEFSGAAVGAREVEVAEVVADDGIGVVGSVPAGLQIPE